MNFQTGAETEEYAPGPKLDFAECAAGWAELESFRAVMSLLSKLNNFNRPLQMSRRRVAFVMIVAVLADAVQFWLGPLGWFGTVQVIDVAAMIITTLTIGFHVLLLPTFLIELFPVIGALPTWTGCVIAVLALRGRDKPDDAIEISTVQVPPAAVRSGQAVPPIIPPPRPNPKPPAADA